MPENREPENHERKQPRRTVLMTAGLTASASVVAASLLGAQARTEDGPARVAQSSAYADPVLEVRDDAP